MIGLTPDITQAPVIRDRVLHLGFGDGAALVSWRRGRP